VLTPAERFTDALASADCRPKRSGPGWAARCPAHEDKQASLSIHEGEDGRVLVKCHAGCTVEDVLAELGLEMRDLFDPDNDDRPLPVLRKDTAPEKTVAADEDELRQQQEALREHESALDWLGKLRGWTPEACERLGLGLSDDTPPRVVFPVRAADGVLVGTLRYSPNPARREAGPKMMASAGCPRELFPAPESIEPGKAVLLVEGEPDAVACWSMGMAAVAVPGAQAWKPEWADRFAGRQVIVCFDCDPPGRAAAAKAANDLSKVAREVRLIDLDPTAGDGRDIGDLCRSHPAERVREFIKSLAKRTKPVEPQGVVLVSFDSVKRKHTDWLLPGRVPVGCLTLLVGEPGCGKSMLTCMWASELSNGVLTDEPQATLMLNAEDSWEATLRPRLEASDADLSYVHAVTVRNDGLESALTLPNDMAELERAVEKTGAKLVVIDPLMAHLPQQVNTWSDQSVRGALAPLARMAERRRCAVVVVAHLNKSNSKSVMQRIGASIGIPAAARSVLYFGKDPANDAQRVLAHVKCNLGPLAPSSIFAMETVVLQGESGSDHKTARLDFIRESRMSANELLRKNDGDGDGPGKS
jgi:archaellum biogenesis ATPase FlaH